MVWSDACESQLRSRFEFKLLLSYRPEPFLERNYNEVHNEKGPMDGIGGIIKNAEFCQVKSRKLVINSQIEFCDTVNKFVTTIKCLYQPEASLIEEPHDIENALVIPNTLQIHRLIREIEEDVNATISFFNLSYDVIQFKLKITKISSDADILKRNFNYLQR